MELSTSKSLLFGRRPAIPDVARFQTRPRDARRAARARVTLAVAMSEYHPPLVSTRPMHLGRSEKSRVARREALALVAELDSFVRLRIDARGEPRARHPRRPGRRRAVRRRVSPTGRPLTILRVRPRPRDASAKRPARTLGRDDRGGSVSPATTTIEGNPERPRPRPAPSSPPPPRRPRRRCPP